MAGTAEIIAGAIKGTADTGVSIWNAYQDYKKFEYQKDLQNKIFAREDNAIQRRVADAEKAGFNKFSVIGEGSNSGSVVSVDAPHIDSDIGSKIADSLSTIYSLAQQKASASLAETEAKKQEVAFSLDKNESVLAKAEQLQALGFNVSVGANRYGDLFLHHDDFEINQWKKYNKQFPNLPDFFDAETQGVKEYDSTPLGKLNLNNFNQNVLETKIKEFSAEYQWLPILWEGLKALNQTGQTISSFRRRRR